ncbi:hypothetical protein Tco_0471796 [Tanacetum coccineum]
MVSPSYSTAPLYPNHPLTQTSPTLPPSRASYYRSTPCMAMRTQPTMSLGFSARVTEAMTLSPLSFRKRYGSSYETPSSSLHHKPAIHLTLPYEIGIGGLTEHPINRHCGLRVMSNAEATAQRVRLRGRTLDCTITRSFTSDNPLATIVVDEEEFLECFSLREPGTAQEQASYHFGAYATSFSHNLRPGRPTDIQISQCGPACKLGSREIHELRIQQYGADQTKERKMRERVAILE